jgi:quercetin dioxygenase-like cupin family protein
MFSHGYRSDSMNSMVTSPHRSVAPSEGETIWFNGALITVKLPGEWSDDAFSLVEVSSTAGRATGLHTDPSHETFYVLDGELLFHVDGEEHRAGPGATVSVRAGVPHAFLVASDTARFLVMNTPGTHDRFFRDGGEPATDPSAPAPPPNLERTMASAQQHGVRFLGPPPFEAAAVRQTSG